MENTKKKRCEFCHRWFLPDYRAAANQYCCSNENCRRQRKLNTHREWLFRHPNYDGSRRPKIKLWAKNSFYWIKWRAAHPDYRRREKYRIQCKPDDSKNGAKQDPIGQTTDGNIHNALQNLTKIVAKQDLILRRTNSLFQSFIGNFPSQNKTI